MSAKMWPRRPAAAREWEEAKELEIVREQFWEVAEESLAGLWRLKEFHAQCREEPGSDGSGQRLAGLQKKFKLPP